MPSVLIALLFLLVPHALHADEPRPRYISLAPAATEILFSLGLDEEIVAVSSFCNYPPAARDKEKIGSFSQPNREKILSLRPDIIFATGLEQAPAVNDLRRLGFRVVVSDPETIDALFASIREIGNLTRRETEADRLIESMRATIDAVERSCGRVAPEQRPQVFVELWHEPLMTAGKGSLVDEVLRRAGGVNIASDTPRPYSMFSPEAVIARNPDFILFAYMDPAAPAARLRRRAGWDRVRAVLTGNLIDDIDPDIILRPGPRLAQAIELLHRKLYSDE
jgi:iron complex transport system substrate-binding protein